MAPPPPTNDDNDGDGLLSSIRMVREMMEQEFSQNRKGPDQDVGHENQTPSTTEPTEDWRSQVFQLKQEHYEEGKRFESELREHRDQIHCLQEKLQRTQTEAATERDLRTTLERTLEAQAAHATSLETQLDEVQQAREVLEQRVKGFLETLDEEKASVAQERASAEQLLEEFRASKAKADARAGTEEAARLRAEAQRDELQAKVAQLQLQLNGKNQEPQQQQQGQLKGSSPPMSSIEDAKSSETQMGMLKQEKAKLKEQLEQQQIQYQLQLDGLEKANKILKQQLTEARSTAKTATSFCPTTAGAAQTNMQKQRKGDAQPPSLEKAIHKASTLVASLQSQVDVMEKAVDVDVEKKRKAPAEAAGEAAGKATSTATANPKTSNAMPDEFLQTMTFATHGEHLRTCDCDECDNVPVPIREAINRRKRQRLETGPMKRTQQRVLINCYHCHQNSGDDTIVGGDGSSNITNKNSGGGGSGTAIMNLWNMMMPLDAEPLVEFGTSHRIVWVKRLSSTSVIKSIGQGIIGSSDEEKNRKPLEEWKEGSMFLVPSTGGKAVGWIHSKAKPKDSSDEATKIADTGTSAYAVLYVAKIPMDVMLPVISDTQHISQDDKQSFGACSWAQSLMNHCQQGLAAMAEKARGNTEGGPGYYQFPAQDCKALKDAISNAEEESGRLPKTK